MLCARLTAARSTRSAPDYTDGLFSDDPDRVTALRVDRLLPAADDKTGVVVELVRLRKDRSTLRGWPILSRLEYSVGGLTWGFRLR